MRILHISDVHVQIDYRRVPLRRLGWRRAAAQFELRLLGRANRYEGALSTLRQLAADADALRADHVLLTGDLTALATREEFECAVSALGPLARDPQRLSIIPGNHDRYTARSVRDKRFERYFGHLIHSDLPRYAVDDGYPYVRLVGADYAVIGLDSTHLAPLPGLSFGRIGKRQLHALGALVEDPALRNRALSVLVHHAPLHHHGGPDRVTHGLWDAKPLLAILAGRPCTLHHGHIHLRYWHRATETRPDIFGGGSSTMLGDEGGLLVDLDGAAVREARVVRPSRIPAAVETCAGLGASQPRS